MLPTSPAPSAGPYRMLDLESYPRIQHYNYFRSLAYPYVGLTAELDLHGLPARLRELGHPFFLSFLHRVTRAANSVPEFRQRIAGDGIAEYQRCRSSHNLALPDGTYCYCTLEDSLPLGEFIPWAREQQRLAAGRRSLSDEGGEDLFYISTLPWLSYTSLVQPVPMPADSNPRITWGRYFQREGRTLLPVTVLCHHALVDGLHISRFFQRLEQLVQDLES